MRKLAIIAIILIALAIQPQTAGSELAQEPTTESRATTRETPPEVLFFISRENSIAKQ